MFSSFPQRVTVLGGTGFLGRAVVQELARKGCRIRVPTRTLEKGEILQMAGMPGQIAVVPALLRTDAEAVETIGEVDAIVNLIGAHRETKRMRFQQVHVEMAARVARIAKQIGVRDLVHLSTLEASLQAPSRYARSKALGEEAVHAFFSPAVILRPSQLFGPGDAFFTRIATMAKFLPFLPTLGRGGARRQPVYVGDVAEAVVRVLEDPSCRGRVFELGGPDVLTRREMIKMALCFMGGERLILPLPLMIATSVAGFAEAFGLPCFSRDQVRRFQSHATVTALPENTLQGLGILPASLSLTLGASLKGFRV